MSDAANSLSSRKELGAALGEIEKVLARHQPGEVTEQMARALQHLVCVRDHLDDGEAGDPRAAPAGNGITLPRLNSLLSVLASIEYPLGGIHWKRIEQVRDCLRQSLAMTASPGPPS